MSAPLAHTGSNQSRTVDENQLDENQLDETTFNSVSQGVAQAQQDTMETANSSQESNSPSQTWLEYFSSGVSSAWSSCKSALSQVKDMLLWLVTCGFCRSQEEPQD